MYVSTDSLPINYRIKSMGPLKWWATAGLGFLENKGEERSPKAGPGVLVLMRRQHWLWRQWTKGAKFESSLAV